MDIGEGVWAITMAIWTLFVIYGTRLTYNYWTNRGMEEMVAVYYNRKIVHMLAAGVVLLITFSSLFAEEKKIPLNASERKLLEQSRIEVPAHYIEAHDFEGEMVSGKKASLADFSGKFLILNFWATWCSPCLKEMPDLDQVCLLYTSPSPRDP